MCRRKYVLRVWREADAIPEIEHAWLYDHLMPIFGDPLGPTYEGWTLLSALAAQTRRLLLGLLVTSNRFRPPALLAKIATTVDIVSGGRLDFGIGVGSRPNPPEAHREYEAHGLPFHDTADAVGAFAEAVTVIRRLWTESEPFDFDGAITRSIHLPVSYDQPGETRKAIAEAIGAGFGHIVLGLGAPYPAQVARWVADEVITAV